MVDTDVFYKYTSISNEVRELFQSRFRPVFLAHPGADCAAVAPVPAAGLGNYPPGGGEPLAGLGAGRRRAAGPGDLENEPGCQKGSVSASMNSGKRGAAMKKQADSTVAAGSTCLRFLHAITRAGEGAELQRITREIAAKAGQLTEPERRKLHTAVNRRFSALNVEAMKGRHKPRWG